MKFFLFLIYGLGKPVVKKLSASAELMSLRMEII